MKAKKKAPAKKVPAKKKAIRKPAKKAAPKKASPLKIPKTGKNTRYSNVSISDSHRIDSEFYQSGNEASLSTKAGRARLRGHINRLLKVVTHYEKNS